MLLAILMCCTLLASCDTTTSESAAVSGTVSDVSSTESTADRYEAATNGVSFGDDVVTIMTEFWAPETAAWFEFGYSYEELENNVVDDAALVRKSKVEDLLHCIIVEDCVDRSANGAQTAIMNSVDSGLNTYTIVAPSILEASLLAQDSYLYDLYELDGLNGLTEKWWDASFIADAEINGKLYYTAGDIGCRTYANIAIMMFNKTMVATLGLESPYTLVKNKQWTLDVVTQWSKLVMSDLDKDGDIDYKDSFGIGGQVDNAASFFYGCEGVTIINGSDGYENNLASTRSVDIMTKVLEIMQNKDYFVSANDYWNEPGYVRSPGELVIKAFAEDRCLLYSGFTDNVELIREMETDFGLLPHPLYDENQDDYYTYVNTWGAPVFGLPVSLNEEEAEKAAVLMNVLGAEGKNYLTPAYYEKCLKGQRARDDESEAMLDIIFASTKVDFGSLYAFDETINAVLFAAAQASTNTYTSICDRNSSKIDSKIAAVESSFVNE